ncbi:hypothetical protein V6N13_135238 [Hibiscus sabdariffa]
MGNKVTTFSQAALPAPLPLSTYLQHYNPLLRFSHYGCFRFDTDTDHEGSGVSPSYNEPTGTSFSSFV